MAEDDDAATKAMQDLSVGGDGAAKKVRVRVQATAADDRKLSIETRRCVLRAYIIGCAL